MPTYEKIRAALEIADRKTDVFDAAKAALAELERAAVDLAISRDFYKRRCDNLQSWQSKMRDPERTIVCDILANGFTLDPPSDRYTTPPPATVAPGMFTAEEMEAAYRDGEDNATGNFHHNSTRGIVVYEESATFKLIQERTP